MKKVLLLVLITTFSLTIFAQEPDSTTNERLKKIEKIQSKLPKISGVINFRYQLSEKINTLDVQRARIDFQGDLSPMFDYRIQVELVTPRLLDAYVRMKIKPWLHIQAGEFRIPFTLENPYTPMNLEFIDISMSTLRLCSYQDISGINSVGRDVGIMFSGSLFNTGEFYRLQYEVGVFNGNGINIVDRDIFKDFIGKICFYPIKHLTISASGYLGATQVEHEINGITENWIMQRKRWSAGIRYDDGKIVARGEYVAGKTGVLESDGFYILVGYTFFDKLMPAIRYDVFRYFKNIPEDYQANYTIGINYWATKFLRCQANYTLNTGNGSMTVIPRNYFNVLITLVF